MSETVCIYFIGTPDGDEPIKVGRTTQPSARLRAIQVNYPRRIELLAYYPGPYVAERQFHSRYKEHKAFGEWFHRHPLILGDIAALKAGTFDPSCLPPAPKMIMGPSIDRDWEEYHRQQAMMCCVPMHLIKFKPC